jgi:thiamine pyrophosphokinase
VINLILHIVAGGPLNTLPNLNEYDQKEVSWVGVDRGLFTLLTKGISPIIGIGDFDSVSEDELKWIREHYNGLEVAPAEKDETDNELALNWAIKQAPEKIRIFGATGGRLDHFLSNVQMLVKGFRANVEIELVDKQNIMCLLEPGTYSIPRTLDYPYLSFLPFSSKVKGINITGVKYPLSNSDIEWGTTLCISNEIIEESGTFSFTEGIVIMVKSKDLLV